MRTPRLLSLHALIALIAAIALWGAVPTAAQIRLERDSDGRIVVTNKGSQASRDLAAPSVAIPQVSEQEKAVIRQKLKTACDRRGLDYALVASLVRAESGFRQQIISKKGAIGLMQLLPATGRRFGCQDPWDLDQNIEGGTAFLAYLKTLFPGETPLILAAYNSGENAVGKYGNKIPPYAETVRYVFRILSDYGKPELVARAKQLLATPGDYDRYYTPFKDAKPVLRIMYTYIDAKGIRHFTDAPPSGTSPTLVVFKDE